MDLQLDAADVLLLDARLDVKAIISRCSGEPIGRVPCGEQHHPEAVLAHPRGLGALFAIGDYHLIVLFSPSCMTL